MKERKKDRTPHIGIYGRRNLGKSSLINAIAGQEIAIVSDIPGTTTDPVKKTIEITGFGPVILIDTAGIDDRGDLGSKRVSRTLRSVDTIDLAILLVGPDAWDEYERNLMRKFNDSNIPFIIIAAKADADILPDSLIEKIKTESGQDIIPFSIYLTETHESIIEHIKKSIPSHSYRLETLTGDLIGKGDIVVLVTPMDAGAPEGRLILPQVQVIRDLLDNEAVAIVLKEGEIKFFLESTRIKPALVITDSQIFDKTDAAIPADIPLTSFSILLARQKGDFASYLKGTPALSGLRNGDRVLLLESCTHHVSCDDIGRVKIPAWINQFTGKKVAFDVVAGLDVLPRPITDYALVIQCGGCMITARQLQQRLKSAVRAGVPVTNYGMAIAYLMGIFDRAVEPFIDKLK